MPLPPFLSLHIVTPDRALVRADVDEVEILGADGYFGVLPGHTPLLAALGIGILWFRKGPLKTYIAVAFGFAEVLPDHVTILAQAAERAEDIDPADADAALHEAQARMSARSADIDVEDAMTMLRQAQSRVEAASKARVRA